MGAQPAAVLSMAIVNKSRPIHTDTHAHTILGEQIAPPRVNYGAVRLYCVRNGDPGRTFSYPGKGILVEFQRNCERFSRVPDDAKSFLHKTTSQYQIKCPVDNFAGHSFG